MQRGLLGTDCSGFHSDWLWTFQNGPAGNSRREVRIGLLYDQTHDRLRMPAEGKGVGAVVYVLHTDIFFCWN